MNVGAFDPSTGLQGTTVVCGAASPGRAEAISVSSAGVFVAGEGGHPGAFGTRRLTADGLFVAKLRELESEVSSPRRSRASKGPAGCGRCAAPQSPASAGLLTT